MLSLVIEKNINKYIREELQMSVSKDLKDRINIKLKGYLYEAALRSKEEGRKTILPRHI